MMACDARHGLHLARRMQPDVVLMDIKMPGMDGLEAMELFAEDMATAQIPIIAISAQAMCHDVEKGMRAGLFRYLSKSIKIEIATEV